MKGTLTLLALSSATLVLAPTQGAQAHTYYYYVEEEPEASPWDKVFALEGHIGLGAPTGLVGVSAELSPFRWLALSGGGGIGIDGFQWAAMPRFRLIAHTRGSVQLGVGASGGKFVYRELFRDEWKIDHAIWVNGEVSYQFRAHNGFQLRPYLGASVMANPDEIVGARGPVRTGDLGTWLIYAGLGVGVAF